MKIMLTNKICIQTGWLGYADYHFNRFSPRVATLSSASNPNHWKYGFLTYIAYPNKVAATNAMKHLLKSGLVDDVDMRKADRMKVKGMRWELKIRGMSLEQVIELAQRDKPVKVAA